ncbi:hypothetical protein AB6B39_00355 [Algimonas porphyrae]|uniref:hypothetical protein n=1 Tax=Algimonas porphyrae TaxID=1128113 RepID=UPI0024E17932|nr:hypothetical protein [Algimonas porphyrae]
MNCSREQPVSSSGPSDRLATGGKDYDHAVSTVRVARNPVDELQSRTSSMRHPGGANVCGFTALNRRRNG